MCISFLSHVMSCHECMYAGADESEEEEEAAAGASGRNGGGQDASGAPVPLHPALVTLALLPRSQWQGLVHLDAIKVCRPVSCGVAHSPFYRLLVSEKCKR